MQASSCRKILLAGLVLLFTRCVVAAPEEHAPLAKVGNLDFSTLLQHAQEHAPQALEMPVRQQQAADFSRSARSLVAGRPALVFSMNDDALLDNTGLKEQEYGLQLPLWRPGEMQAARQQANGYAQQTRAWEAWLQWQLAGELRSVLLAMEAAETMLVLEQKAVSTAGELHAVTERLLAAGAVARLDLLQAQNLLFTRQKNLLEAEAALVDAERYYMTLTGLQARPATVHRERLSEQEEINVQHPLLQYLQTEVTVAESGIKQSEIAARGSPQLTIGSRRERGDRFAPYTDSIGISLNIPVGGKSLVTARTSSARRLKADAEVALLSARRSLQQQLHEAEHELLVTRQSLPLAEQQFALGEQRLSMAQSAYTAGELTLVQVLAAVQEAAQAERELLGLRVQEQLLIARFNQYLGVMP